MSTPDVRVRLSPEGVKEVIAALRAVQNEGGKAGKSAAKEMGLVSQAGRELKSVLGRLGLAAVVVGFAAMAKQSLEAALATGKLASSVGGTVEEVSALTLAFKENESDQGALQKALVRTAVLISDVRSGSKSTSATLRAIGVDLEAFGNASTTRGFELIAQRFAQIPPGGQRAAAAVKLFGKNLAGELLPSLQAVGEKGIDPFIEKARTLGVLIDSDLADAAARADDALDDLKTQAAGVATQFTAGFAPQIAEAMASFTESTSGSGVNSMRILGDFVGRVLRTIVGLFEIAGSEIGSFIAQVAANVRGLSDILAAVVALDFEKVGEISQRVDREVTAIVAAADDRRKAILANIAATPEELAGNRPQRPKRDQAAIVEEPTEDDRKAASARESFVKAKIDNELRLVQAALKAQQQLNEQALEAGTISLQEYYARRLAIVQAGQAAEQHALEQQQARAQRELSRVQADPESKPADEVKAQQELAEIQARITQQRIESAAELSGLEADRAKAQKDLGREVLDSQTELAGLENRRHDVFAANLDSEIRQIRELGTKAGQTADEIEAHVQRLTQARTAQFNLDDVTRRGESALAAFDRDAQLIRRDQEAGVITQLEGEQRLIALEQQRLVVLQQLAAEMTAAAAASGDPEAIAKAQQFADSIDQIALSYQQATNFASQFRSGGLEAFQSGIESLLSNVQNIESVGDAFRSLGQTVAQTLQKIAAEILAKQAVLALLRAFGGGLPVPVPGAQRGGHVRGYAGGGDVVGPSLPIPGPDKVPILAQSGEFMMRRARVMEPGALAFLRGWNSGRFALRDVMSRPRFVTGGLVGGAPNLSDVAPAGARQGNRVRIVNAIDKQFAVDAMDSAAGEDVILNVIERNSSRIRQQLGS